MPLTFKTADLIALIDQIVSAKHAEDARYDADVAAAKHEHQQQWWDDNRERIRELRDYLTKSLKADTPPGNDQAKRIMGREARYSDDVQFFVPANGSSVDRKQIGYYRIDELEGLSALLKAHQSGTVTAHQLKELGTHPKDLEKLFRAAVQAGAAVSK